MEPVEIGGYAAARRAAGAGGDAAGERDMSARDQLRAELGDEAANVIGMLKFEYDMLILKALEEDADTFHRQIDGRRDHMFQRIKNMGISFDFDPPAQELKIKRLVIAVLAESFAMFADVLDPDAEPLPPGL